MVLERLRRATRPIHADIERIIDILPIPTRARYTWFLAKQYGFLVPLEAAWDACPLSAELDLPARRRAPLLVSDLSVLGLDAGRLPLCHALPPLGDPAQALGALYVVEGSTLGGRALAPRVGEALGLGPEQGAAFLHGRGARTLTMWKTFCAHVEALAAGEPQQVPAMVDAARDCFERLRRWFKETE